MGCPQWPHSTGTSPTPNLIARESSTAACRAPSDPRQSDTTEAGRSHSSDRNRELRQTQGVPRPSCPWRSGFITCHVFLARYTSRVSSSLIKVSYNEDLKPLEDLLKNVRRSGDFFTQGTLETPLPRVEVDGVGVLSFPVPGGQSKQIIQQAERAPYGRGSETILDTSVRKVWQLKPSQVRIHGKSWDNTLTQIVASVSHGLGMAETAVQAELYKFLVYDEGGFFKTHRDTEKSERMFGTLVVVLPSMHRGGELVVRHAGKEAVLDLSTNEVSEIKFAAFYADCEHEVRPVTDGYRVCLVYNLVQHGNGNLQPSTAPFYENEMAEAARILADTFNQPSAPAKLAWLFQHQYSPAGLSFADLKGEDAALGKVLLEAGQRANCAVHLSIVHIEETGPAEPEYQPRRSRWSRRYDEDDDVEDVSGCAYEVIEVSEAFQYLDEWRDTSDCTVSYGRVPLEECELLPNGALDDEPADQDRLTEATGNEGATFERSYLRAALVLWPQTKFAEVLLQAGVGAALPYLRERVDQFAAAGNPATERESVRVLAEKIVHAWETSSRFPDYRLHRKEADRVEAIHLLSRIGEAALLSRFVRGVLSENYDGHENEALVASVSVMEPKDVGVAASELIEKNFPSLPAECIDLLARLEAESRLKTAAGEKALNQIAETVVDSLARLEPPAASDALWNYHRQNRRYIDSACSAGLLNVLARLGITGLRAKANTAIIKKPGLFDPGTVIVPALEKVESSDFWPHYSTLWKHAAEFLLARSEQAPKAPTDWRQEVEIKCNCEDCKELQTFARSPVEQVHRFRVRQDRRQHLHSQINAHGLDMSHVTERKGSPQTLVCTKTRRKYQLQCQQHQNDIAALQALASLAKHSPDAAELLHRIAEAAKRKPDQV